MLCRRPWLSPCPFCVRNISSLANPGPVVASPPSLATDAINPQPKSGKPTTKLLRAKTPTKASALEISRNDWLLALSSPPRSPSSEGSSSLESLIPVQPVLECNDCQHSSVVLGIDPDVSGAIAVLRGDDVSNAQVFDVPSVRVIVGSQQRRRHDARSIVDLLNKLNVPPGCVAYLEQSIPLPKDGKQGWWGSGFGFGIWIGSLVASGISVVPVPASVWKQAMDVSGKTATKDDCRACASAIFPLLAPQLKRKKDHGRAEALLIAAYGKGLTPPLRGIKLETDDIVRTE